MLSPTAPELKQPPQTPTSPGDGRLRGILKKSSPSPNLTIMDQMTEMHLKEQADYSQLSSDESTASSPKSPAISNNNPKNGS